MLLLSEFITYLIKFVVFGLIAFAGIMFGIRHKKSKLAKETVAIEDAAVTEQE